MRSNGVALKGYKQSGPVFPGPTPCLCAYFIAASQWGSRPGVSPRLLAGSAPLGFAAQPERAGNVLNRFRRLGDFRHSS